MWSSGASVGGRHSIPELTRRRDTGSPGAIDGSTAPTAMVWANRYSVPDWPGHWPDGSLEVFMNGLPLKPKLVTFWTTLPTVSTAPCPKTSGTAVGPTFARYCGEPNVARIAPSVARRWAAYML